MIRTARLEKRIGRQEILRGVDISIGEGQTLVIVGQSGSGKSVLLKHLIGLMRPTAGEVWIDGQNIVGWPERELLPIRKKVSMVFQGAALFDSMSVAENLAFPLRESGERAPDTIRRKIAEALETVGLAGQEEKMPEKLSGGMRKRVGLARAIITCPRCILYDEPTAGLDPIVADSINRLIRRLQMKFHVTSIVVTHDMKTAFHVADQIAYLHEGRIRFSGSPDAFSGSADPLVRDFIEGRSHEEEAET